MLKPAKMAIFGDFLNLRVNLWGTISRDCERVRRSRFREEVAEELRLRVGGVTFGDLWTIGGDVTIYTGVTLVAHALVIILS